MTMDSHEPRPFDCPACGHHHEADLHEMVGHPEIHGKMPCAGCGALLWLSLNDDGEALVELYEEHLHDEAHKDRVAAAKAKREAERAAAVAAQAAEASKSSSIAPTVISVIVSALVAAIVSGFMSRGGDDAPTGGDAKREDARWSVVQTLQQDVEALRGAAGDAGAQAKSVQAKLDEFMVSAQARLDALAAKHADDGNEADAVSKALDGLKSELMKELQTIQTSQTELGNRIEGYYVTVRQLEGRLKKLEKP